MAYRYIAWMHFPGGSFLNGVDDPINEYELIWWHDMTFILYITVKEDDKIP